MQFTGVSPTFHTCSHCGYGHTGACPRIKAIEYHQNGTVKRVEYHDMKPLVVGRPDPTVQGAAIALPGFAGSN